MNTHQYSQPKKIIPDNAARGALAERMEYETSTHSAQKEARTEEPLLVDVRAITKMLNISEPTLWRLRQSGDFPDGILITPKMRRWFREDIVAWVAKKAAAQSA